MHPSNQVIQKPHYDHALWFSAEKSLNGANVHRLRCAMTQYRLLWELTAEFDEINRIQDIEQSARRLRRMVK